MREEYFFKDKVVVSPNQKKKIYLLTNLTKKYLEFKPPYVKESLSSSQYVSLVASTNFSNVC